MCMTKKFSGKMLQMLGTQVEMAVSAESYFGGKIESQ